MPLQSNRAIHLFDSPFRKYIPLANAAKREGVHVHHLNIGQPDLSSPSAPFQVFKSHQPKYIPYCPANGLDELIQSAVQFYQMHNVQIQSEDLLITTGASEGLLMALMSCCNPGDEILIPQPCYANYLGFCQLAGVTPIGITSLIEEGFSIPAASTFQSLITNRTKAILLSNPSNPTGKLYRKEDLLALCELALEKDLFLIVDEAYRDFIYTNDRFFSILEIMHAHEHIVMIDSISKRFNACGARVGFMISRNKDLLESGRKQARLRLSSPYFEQLWAAEALKIDPSYYLHTQNEYRKRRDIVAKHLSQMPNVKFHLPEGAFYFFVKLPVQDAEEFCRWLLTDFRLDNQTVMLAHGSAFYIDEHLGRDEVRIAYVLEVDKLQRAMECLQMAVEQYRVQSAIA